MVDHYESCFRGKATHLNELITENEENFKTQLAQQEEMAQEMRLEWVVTSNDHSE